MENDPLVQNTGNSGEDRNDDNDVYVPTKQDEIETLYRTFVLRRIGGVYPRQLADYIENHARTRFASDAYVKDFVAGLRASFLLTEVLRETSLAIPNNMDLDDVPEEGTWDDLIRQMTTIVTLWSRIDRALLSLARQHLLTTHESPNSADGMGVIKDSVFATPLLDFLEMLNLFPGKKFVQQILDWFELTEALLDNIHNGIERRAEEKLRKRCREKESRGEDKGKSQGLGKEE